MELQALHLIRRGADPARWIKAGERFTATDARGEHYVTIGAAVQVGEGAPAQPAKPTLPKLRKGQLVQVEIAGVLQLPEPRRVRDIRQDDGMTWVRVAGHKAFVPRSQIKPAA